MTKAEIAPNGERVFPSLTLEEAVQQASALTQELQSENCPSLVEIDGETDWQSYIARGALPIKMSRFWMEHVLPLSVQAFPHVERNETDTLLSSPNANTPKEICSFYEEIQKTVGAQLLAQLKNRFSNCVPPAYQQNYKTSGWVRYWNNSESDPGIHLDDPYPADTLSRPSYMRFCNKTLNPSYIFTAFTFAINTIHGTQAIDVSHNGKLGLAKDSDRLFVLSEHDANAEVLRPFITPKPDEGLLATGPGIRFFDKDGKPCIHLRGPDGAHVDAMLHDKDDAARFAPELSMPEHSTALIMFFYIMLPKAQQFLVALQALKHNFKLDNEAKVSKAVLLDQFYIELAALPEFKSKEEALNKLKTRHASALDMEQGDERIKACNEVERAIAEYFPEQYRNFYVPNW